MTTFGDLIHDTERYLLSGDRDQMNRLHADIDNAQTSVMVDFDLQGLQDGAYIDIDLETMYVWATNDGAKTATVQRGMLGTTAAAHTGGSLVHVNAKFSKQMIAEAINQEIRDLSAPPNGLWQVKAFTLTTVPVQKTYEIPVVNIDALDILEVRYQPPGPELRWDRIWRRDMTGILRDMPETGIGVTFPNSGMGFRIEPSLYPGRVMSVRYAAPFTELVNLADDAIAVSGIPASAVDIPPLGAAARLMGVREAKRAFSESEVDTRRASEVPVGASANAAKVILSLLNERIKTEYMRLVAQWPQLR